MDLHTETDLLTSFKLRNSKDQAAAYVAYPLSK